MISKQENVKTDKQFSAGCACNNPLHSYSYKEHSQNQGKIYSFVFKKQHMLVLSLRCAYFLRLRLMCVYVCPSITMRVCASSWEKIASDLHF